LLRAGFTPGLAFRVSGDHERQQLTIAIDASGDRHVSHKTSRKAARKTTRDAPVPVIDLNSTQTLASLSGLQQVRIVIRVGTIHVLALASHRKAAARALRLQKRLHDALPLRCASVAFGAGITSWALHAGLANSGLSTTLVAANEIREDLVATATSNNSVCTPATAITCLPMQEAVMDDWTIARIGAVDLLEIGIPCSGASVAGAAKRGLTRMEDHPLVGHLVVAAIQWIAALQPAIVLIENVPPYARSASAAILRAWLRDAGYRVQEVELEARLFGSLEHRVRWFLVAHPASLDLTLNDLAPPLANGGQLGDLLDDIASDDPRFRPVEYLLAKEQRDQAKGNGFRTQWLDATSTSVPTLRKGYHKGGSTDPRLRHPTNPALSRLLSAAEHARIKGIPDTLLAGVSETTAHQICGQSVDTRPVRAVGQRIGEALLRFAEMETNFEPEATIASAVAA